MKLASHLPNPLVIFFCKRCSDLYSIAMQVCVLSAQLCRKCAVAQRLECAEKSQARTSIKILILTDLKLWLREWFWQQLHLLQTTLSSAQSFPNNMQLGTSQTCTNSCQHENSGSQGWFQSNHTILTLKHVYNYPFLQDKNKFSRYLHKFPFHPSIPLHCSSWPTSGSDSTSHFSSCVLCYHFKYSSTQKLITVSSCYPSCNLGQTLYKKANCTGDIQMQTMLAYKKKCQQS